MDTVAGEGDEIQDRLTCLSELCGNFSPTIYRLHGVRCNFHEVMEIFKETWDNLISLSDPVSLVVSVDV